MPGPNANDCMLFGHVALISHHESKTEVIQIIFIYKLRSSDNSFTFMHSRVNFFDKQRRLGFDRNYKAQSRMGHSSRSSVLVDEMKKG